MLEELSFHNAYTTKFNVDILMYRAYKDPEVNLMENLILAYWG
jgi:hypothetical protein